MGTNMQDIQFLSTLSLRRATLRMGCRVSFSMISIHALLAESDSCPPARPFHCHDFYPRSPCGERPLSHRLVATQPSDFYPRSPCGERLVRVYELVLGVSISIHALLAESDYLTNYHFTGIFIFLSTLSLRRATILTILICIALKFLSTLSLRRATNDVF